MILLQILHSLFVFSVTQLLFYKLVNANELEFRSVKISPSSRIDAISYFGDGVVLAGTRDPNPGYIHKSNDYGVTWHTVGNITGSDFITCLSSGNNGSGFLLTGRDAHVWRTTDYGDTWNDLGQVSKASNPIFASAYGLLVTSNGTILVADADIHGGHIHRSVDDGKTWQDLGRISTHPLYRLIEVGDGVIVNGWAGHIYKSTDDGVSWKDLGEIADSELYAIEFVPPCTVLIGTEKGHIFSSNDNGVTWKDNGIVAPHADDFVWIGGSSVLYSTYAGNRLLYLSKDLGTSWIPQGSINTGQPDDWLDHVIYIQDKKRRVVVGGSNKGYILHSFIPNE